MEVWQTDTDSKMTVKRLKMTSNKAKAKTTQSCKATNDHKERQNHHISIDTE